MQLRFRRQREEGRTNCLRAQGNHELKSGIEGIAYRLSSDETQHLASRKFCRFAIRIWKFLGLIK